MLCIREKQCPSTKPIIPIQNDSSNIHSSSKEYSFKYMSFHPTNNSPNLFMTKLEQRISQYYLEMELHKDPLNLDTK